MAVAAVATSGVKAQSVTYNHNSPKQKPDYGYGNPVRALFTPELYYTLLHNRSRRMTASQNKLSFRTLAGVNLYNQTDEAEAIDSALVKRAEIEALNVANQQIDLAWLAEGDKINAQMERLQRNIDRIPLAGGTTDERERWTESVRVYQCAIDATKDAYMPNAQRKKSTANLRGRGTAERDSGRLPCPKTERHGCERAAECNRRPETGQGRYRPRGDGPVERIAFRRARGAIGRRN